MTAEAQSLLGQLTKLRWHVMTETWTALETSVVTTIDLFWFQEFTPHGFADNSEASMSWTSCPMPAPSLCLLENSTVMLVHTPHPMEFASPLQLTAFSSPAITHPEFASAPAKRVGASSDTSLTHSTSHLS